jgi:uncharacterized damage-inducible protein DinB
MSNETYNIATGFLGEFNGEITTTRKFLQRVSTETLSWKPNVKSMSMGQLAIHIAQVPNSVITMALKDSAEIPDLSHFEEAGSTVQILDALNLSETNVRELLTTISDKRMHEEMHLTKDGITIMTLSRVGFLRLAMLNHWYHHRGQLSVYFRLLGQSVPSAYGPTADEQ